MTMLHPRSGSRDGSEHACAEAVGKDYPLKNRRRLPIPLLQSSSVTEDLRGARETATTMTRA